MFEHRFGEKREPLFMKSQYDYRVVQEKISMHNTLKGFDNKIQSCQDWQNQLRVYDYGLKNDEISNFFVSKQNEERNKVKPEAEEEKKKKRPNNKKNNSLLEELSKMLDIPMICHYQYESGKCSSKQQELKRLFEKQNLKYPEPL